MYETLFVIEPPLPPATLRDVVPFVVVGVALVAFGIRSRSSRPISQVAVFCTFGLLVALGGWKATFATRPRHAELYRAYTGGKCQVVEGAVHLDHLEPAEGHGIGEFGHIGGEPFRIDRYPAYDQAVAHGGVLREGVRVRVWLYNDAVLRIDSVPKPGASGSAVPDASGSAKASPEERRTTQVDGG